MLFGTASPLIEADKSDTVDLHTYITLDKRLNNPLLW